MINTGVCSHENLLGKKVPQLKHNVADIKRSTVEIMFADTVLLWEDVDTYSINR